MLISKLIRKRTRTLFQGCCFLLVPLRHQTIENPFWLPDKFLRDAQLAQTGASQVILIIAKQFFPNREESPSTRLLLRGCLRHQTQRFILETDFDPISSERTLVLSKNAALRELHDLVKIVRDQFLADDPDRKPPDEFRLEPVLDKILGRDVAETIRYPSPVSAPALNPICPCARRRDTCCFKRSNAPLTTKRMCRVLIVSRFAFPPRF